MARTRGTVSRATSSRGGHGGGEAASYEAPDLDTSSPRLASRGIPRPRRGGRRGGRLGRAASARLLEMLQTGDWTSRRLRSATANQSASADDSEEDSSSSDGQSSQAPSQQVDREQPVAGECVVTARPGSMPSRHPSPPPVSPPEQTLTEREEAGMKSYTDMVHELIRELNIPDLSAHHKKATLAKIARFTSMLPDSLRLVGIYRARAFAATLPQAARILTDAYDSALNNVIPRNRPSYHHDRVAQCFIDWPGLGWLPPWPEAFELKTRDVLGCTETGHLSTVISRAAQRDIERRRLYEPGGVVYEAVLHFSDGDAGKMRWSCAASRAAQYVSESMGLVNISRTHPSFLDAVARSKESQNDASKVARASGAAEAASSHTPETQDRPPDDAESPATDSSAAGCINVSVSPVPTDMVTRTRPTTREGPSTVAVPASSALPDRRASQEKTLIMFFKRDGGRWTVRRTDPKQNQRPEKEKEGEDDGGRVRKRPRLKHQTRQADAAWASRAAARPTTDRDTGPFPADSNPAINDASADSSLTPSTQLALSDASTHLELPTDTPNSPPEHLILESIQHQTVMFNGLAKSLSKCIPPALLPGPPTPIVLQSIDHCQRQIRTLERTATEKLQICSSLVDRQGSAAQELARVQGRAAKWRADVQRCEANLANLEKDDAIESSSPDEDEDEDEDESEAEERAESRRMRKAALDAVRGRAEHARAQVQRRKEEEVIAGALVQNLKGQYGVANQETIASRKQLGRAKGTLELLKAREAARTAYLEVGKQLGFAE